MISQTVSDLPYLIGITFLGVVLVLSTLIWVSQANKLRETLRHLILAGKDQLYSAPLYKAIFHQLHLSLKYKESLKNDIHSQMLEMLEMQERSSRELLLPQLLKLFFVRLSAFAGIIKRSLVARQPNANETILWMHREAISKQPH